MPTIYLPKKELEPAFGYADIKNQTIYIRNDLPKVVQKFLEAHETYHLSDKTKWWVWRECLANAYGAYKHPFGFLYCCVLSLSWDRLKFYWDRIKRGK